MKSRRLHEIKTAGLQKVERILVKRAVMTQTAEKKRKRPRRARREGRRKLQMILAFGRIFGKMSRMKRRKKHQLRKRKDKI